MTDATFHDVTGERFMALATSGAAYVLSASEEEDLLDLYGLVPLAKHCERMDKRLLKTRAALAANKEDRAVALAAAAERDDDAFRAGQRRLWVQAEQAGLLVGLTVVPTLLIMVFL